MKRRNFLIAAATLPLGAAAAQAASHAEPVEIAIRGFAFSPSKVEIKPGQTVKWINKDGARHSATADNRSFDTGLFGRNASAQVTFDKAGTFPYFCKAHPGMKGTIVVKG